MWAAQLPLGVKTASDEPRVLRHDAMVDHTVPQAIPQGICEVLALVRQELNIKLA